jgi:hypothetical protein
MAANDANTLTREVDFEVLEEASNRAEFAHSLAELITESASFKNLSPHQQNTLMALTTFTFDVKNAISEIINPNH